MFKDLLVPVVLGEVCTDAFDAACALAGEEGGRVTALVAVSVVTPVVGTMNYFPDAVYDSLREAAAQATQRLREQAEACLARHDVAGETQVSDSIWLTSPEAAVLHAHYADLVLLGRAAGATVEAERAVFSSLLLGSGRPLLLVPREARWPSPLGKVVVAWRPSPEASRALHDALPLLRRARSVDLVVVDPRVGETAHGELPGADIAAHLGRHGLAVDVVSVPREGLSTGEAILRHAREAGAQLVVAGGYGHSRMREQVFGGVTRHLFEHATVPVFFSH
ncbi:MAG TPA: universal stress protein [Luteimonas sp.]|nr:universal stress protein [Luteimonas sp.]